MEGRWGGGLYTEHTNTHTQTYKNHSKHLPTCSASFAIVENRLLVLEFCFLLPLTTEGEREGGDGEREREMLTAT